MMKWPCPLCDLEFTDQEKSHTIFNGTTVICSRCSMAEKTFIRLNHPLDRLEQSTFLEYKTRFDFLMNTVCIALKLELDFDWRARMSKHNLRRYEQNEIDHKWSVIKKVRMKRKSAYSPYGYDKEQKLERIERALDMKRWEDEAVMEK